MCNFNKRTKRKKFRKPIDNLNTYGIFKTWSRKKSAALFFQSKSFFDTKKIPKKGTLIENI